MARNEKNTRMCSGCRTRKNKAQLIRICKSKDGVFTVTDGSVNTDGRGAYVCRDSKCVENAIKRKSFSRSFGCELPPDITDKLNILALQ